MKETKKSLKIYFIVVSLLGLLGTVAGVLMAEDVATKVLLGIYIVIPITFFYYGINLYNYLQKSPKTLINMVRINWAISIIIYGLGLNLTGIIISSLLGWYLINNIKKLSSTEVKS